MKHVVYFQANVHKIPIIRTIIICFGKLDSIMCCLLQMKGQNIPIIKTIKFGFSELANRIYCLLSGEPSKDPNHPNYNSLL